MRIYSLTYLQSRPTLAVGQTSNLKVELKRTITGTERHWLSRCTVEDGEPFNNKVTVERLVNGRWVESDTYQAR